MAQAIAANEVTLRQLKQAFGLQQADSSFFPEWLEAGEALGEEEQRLLDRVKGNFVDLMEDPPLLENSIQAEQITQ